MENRARLALEVVDAVIGEWDAAHVGIRLSPMIKFGGLDDADGMEIGLYLAAALQERALGYLHLCEPDWAGGPELDSDFRAALRNAFSGIIVGAGHYTVAKAEEMIADGFIDAAAFGRPFIANPDLPTRLFEDLALNEVDLPSVYGSEPAGYPAATPITRPQPDDTTSAPTSTDERPEHVPTTTLNGVDRAALSATLDAVREKPALAQVSFTLNSAWSSGCHQRSQTGEMRQNGEIVAGRESRYVLESDEPAALLGTDKAPNPGNTSCRRWPAVTRSPMPPTLQCAGSSCPR